MESRYLSTILEKHFIGPIKLDISLGPLTTLGVGGKADICLWPATAEDLAYLYHIKAQEAFPLYILGGGSNVIISDKTLHGVVLCTRYMSSFSVERQSDKAYIEVGAGLPLSHLVAWSHRYGFSGLEFAIGIPGTVGGAVVGNAGVKGEAVSQAILWVETVDGEGHVCRWKKEDLEWGYRTSELRDKDVFVSSCGIELRAESIELVEAKMNEHWIKRSSQPYHYKSAGCIFKNPEGESAGRLLDISGCKGLRVGDAIVSEAHANFILNAGQATAADILALIEKCRKIVMERTGYMLELEVRIFELG